MLAVARCLPVKRKKGTGKDSSSKDSDDEGTSVEEEEARIFDDRSAPPFPLPVLLSPSDVPKLVSRENNDSQSRTR
jgi:hypothetical protein